MEHLQNAELHENINSVTLGDSPESVNKPKPHKKKYARICLSDLFGQTHTDILLRLRRYGNLLWLTRERQVVDCTYPNSAFKKEQKAQVVKAVVP